MTRVAPRTEVTVVPVGPTDGSEKQERPQQDSDRAVLKQKIVAGIWYSLGAACMLYALLAAVSFVADVFTLLLVLTRH